MEEILATTRWRRYGHDRLYVTGSQGRKIGWVELATGQVHAESAVEVELVQDAWRTWQAQPGNSVHSVHPKPSPEPTPRPNREPMPQQRVKAAPTDWFDLAENRAGQQTDLQAMLTATPTKPQSWLVRLFNPQPAPPPNSWAVGADGERQVGLELGILPAPWRVLHAIPVGEGNADIDHVVIGPAGVFTINTKHHRTSTVWVGGNTLLVNGARTHYVRNSRFEAQRAARLLKAARNRPVEVRGLIVVISESLTVKDQPKDVQVLSGSDLVTWLHRQPNRLGPAEIDATFEVARRSTTWFRD